jgi:tRNA(Ile)-lysidine synthase
MIEKLQDPFHNRCPFDSTRILIVGISGGPDSLCLLDLLYKAGLRVVAAHLNHQLRAEADADADHVRQIAEAYRIPCVIHVEDVGAFAQTNALSVEEAARMMRYRFLFAEAKQWDAQAVVVGHTADDQVETVLMHLLRGAGLEGLKGMDAWQLPNAWSKEIPLARPLLGMWREDTVAYCHTNGLQPVMDLSNLDMTYFRNRLRHELIPTLEAISPRFKMKLTRMAEVLRGDLQILEPVVELAWEKCIREVGSGYFVFGKELFVEQPAGMQRRLIRKAMGQLRTGIRDIGFETVERGLSFLKQPAPRGQVDLKNGLRMVVQGDGIWIATWEADLLGNGWIKVGRESEPARLTPPGRIELVDPWWLNLEEVMDIDEGRRLAFENTDPYHAWLDADQITGALEVRARKAGDYIRPLGLGGHRVKIADLMINVKMPRAARAVWPLVCCAGEVIWVPGYATSHVCRVRSETRRMIHFWLSRME